MNIGVFFWHFVLCHGDDKNSLRWCVSHAPLNAFASLAQLSSHLICDSEWIITQTQLLLLSCIHSTDTF